MGTRDFDAVAARWGIRTVMLLREDLGRLVDVIRRSPNWVLVHLDARELVFVRDIPEHAELIRRFRIDPRAPWVARGPQPEERPTGWWRRFGAVGRPWHSLGMAQSLLHVGAVDAALAYLEKAHREFPDHREVRLALAQTYRSRGRDPEAEHLVAGLRISPQESARMAEMLAGLALNEGRPRDAAEALGRVAASRPSDPALAAHLGKARFEAGDYRGAAAAYATATRLDPGRPDHWLGLGHCLALLGDDAGAIDAYRGALRADAATAQAHYNLGILLGRRGDAAGRERHLREALRLQPGYEPARRALAAGP
jgi:Flp pilus assembly protein TadD